jgi:hypothetical protein
MGRFIRDFGFLASVVLLPVGIYLLYAATESRAPDASFSLLGSAFLIACGLLSVYSAIREHFIMRDHVRYAHGRRRPGAADRPVRT